MEWVRDDDHSRSTWRRYGAALVSVGLASLFSALLHPWLVSAPLAPFFGAVALVAWYAGAGPSAAAIVLSLLPISLVALAPYGAWSLSGNDRSAMLIFVLISALLVLLSASRDQAERAMRTSERRFRGLLATANEGVWVVDRDARTQYVNDRMATLLGTTTAQLAAGTVLDFVFPEDLPQVQDRISANLAGGAEVFDFRFRRGDGEAVLVLAGTSPVHDTSGAVVGALGLFTDITARRQAEVALHESETRLRALLEQLPVGIGLTDAQGRWVLRNPVMLAYMGDTIPSRDPDARARWQAWDADGRPIAPAEWPGARALRGEAVPGVDFVYTNEAGIERWMRVSAAPFRDSAGEVIGAVNVVQDIDAWKRAETALRESEAKFSRLFDAGVMGLLVADRERILEANDTLLHLIGATRADLEAGRLSWAELTPPEYAELDARAIAEIATRGRCTPFEKEYLRPDGTRVPVLLGAAALQGTEPPWICAVLDLTPQKSAERERVAFIDAATHDLKNPLTSIKARAQLLQRRVQRAPVPEPAALAAGLAAIEADATRMVTLIGELMDAAHLRTGQSISLTLVPTDLVALAHDCAADIRRRTRHCVMVESTDAVLVGAWDRARLERVVQNLLDNAVKYSPAGGDIVLRVGHELDVDGTAWATLAVQDHGMGIPAADLPYVFERFRRASNVGVTPGAGIGLAGARQIVVQHSGTITVESVEGHGSTFTVRLPLERR